MPPVPVGDPPTGMARAQPWSPTLGWRRCVLLIPSGGSPDGTGQWPVLPDLTRPMWHGFCEHLRECGRNGTLFVFVLATIFVLAPMGTLGVLALLGLLIGGAAWVAGEIAAQRNHHERLGKMPPLSENDLRAARSKLTGHRVKS